MFSQFVPNYKSIATVSQLFGADSTILKNAAEKLKNLVSIYPEVSAVEDDLAYDKEELILDLTPQGQALGFTIDQLGAKLRHRLNGITAAKYPLGSRTMKHYLTVKKIESKFYAVYRTKPFWTIFNCSNLWFISY